MVPGTNFPSSSTKHDSSTRTGERSRRDRATVSQKQTDSRNRSSNNYWDVVLDRDMTSLSLSDRRIREGDSRLRPSGSRAISKATPSHCAICKASFTSARAYEEHMKTCKSEVDRPHRCQECGISFKKNSNLTKHVKMVHLGEKEHACPEPGCGRMFGQKSNLSSHIRAVHYGEKPFECTEPGCGRRFAQKSGLKAHIKTVHYGERPYVCKCGSSFGHSGDLNRHIRVVHERQRPFECHLCPDRKAFGRKSVLMRHMQTHGSASTDASYL